MSFGDLPVREFNAALAEGSPTPGGGAAAALTGATAAALGEMVCAVTLADEDFADVHDELRRRRDDLRSLRGALADMADADAAAFEEVMDAYRTPSDDPDRQAAIREALLGAAEVPLETAEACLSVIEHAAAVAEIGNQNAVTDAAAAVLLGRAALEAALYNVDVNLKDLEDDDRVAGIAERRRDLDAEAQAAVDRVEAHLETAL